MSHLIKERSTKIFIGFFLIFFPSSQFLIPITAIFPEQLNFLYFPFLLVLLLGLVFFSFITVSYYSIISERTFEVENKVQEDSKKQQALFIKQLKIGYSETNKVYFIEIEFLIDHKSVVERVENRKILLPFSNWMLFSIAKKLDVKLLNHDIALTKFRMVEYWNKESETKLTQEFLFINDFGSFEFNIDDTIILFENLDFLESKLIITEAIQKHIDNFSSLQSNQKLEVADIFSILRK